MQVHSSFSTPSVRATHQRGASLITVMLILIVVSALGIGAVQISMMGERSARNDRDMQVAWQAAEAALMDAEFDIRGPMASSRRAVFGMDSAMPNLTLFDEAGCGSTGLAIGLCALVSEAQAAAGSKQKWLTVNFLQNTGDTPSARYGQYTNQSYPFGTGVRSAREPRYVIEPVRDYGTNPDKTAMADAKYLYRVTAMGFGPRDDIRAVAQMLLRP